ncbi:hypothetical protein Q8A73_008733 [Channa argus]|nr:hypothetical protein Q8A73_008733 [Channa argus]
MRQLLLKSVFANTSTTTNSKKLEYFPHLAAKLFRSSAFDLTCDAVRKHFTSCSETVSTCQRLFLDQIQYVSKPQTSGQTGPSPLRSSSESGSSGVFNICEPHGICSVESIHKPARLAVSSLPADGLLPSPDKLWPFVLCSLSNHLLETCVLVGSNQLPALQTEGTRWMVSALCRLFNESRSDQESKEVVGEITDYNKRYSGAPRQVTDYLFDTPRLLQLLGRSLSTMGGLVWLFFFRVILCCIGTMVSISSPPLDPVSSSSAGPLEKDPSLCGMLEVMDDLVVVILLLICVININQQMAPETRNSTNDTSQGLMGNSL